MSEVILQNCIKIGLGSLRFSKHCFKWILYDTQWFVSHRERHTLSHFQYYKNQWRRKEPRLNFLPVISQHEVHVLYKSCAWVTYPSRWNIKLKLWSKNYKMWFFVFLDAWYKHPSYYKSILILFSGSQQVVVQYCKITIHKMLVQVGHNSRLKG